jgi:hypothetical protein
MPEANNPGVSNGTVLYAAGDFVVAEIGLPLLFSL